MRGALIGTGMRRDGLQIPPSAAFVGLGLWLESVNGKHGFSDELLTPFPLGLAGAALALIEEAWA
jgi:hypothetical protein